MYKTDSEDTLVPTETAPNPRRSCPQSKFPVVEQAQVQKPQGLHVLGKRYGRAASACSAKSKNAKQKKTNPK